MFGMLGDAFEFQEPTSSSSGPNDEAQVFFKLVEDARQSLYPGCEEFSTLSFIVEMYHLKCLYGITNVAIDAFIKLINGALPKDSTLLNSFKKIQGIIKKLGLGYKRIDVCPNDCVLFWKEKHSLDKCPICDALRWKTVDDGTIIELANGQKVPKKVLRHFPLIPRLKRLFMSAKIAPFMRWHKHEHKKDGNLRHPTNSYACKHFNDNYPEFASDP